MESTFKELNMVREFEEFSKMTIRELNKVARFAYTKGAQIIKKQTLSNLRSTLPAAFNRNSHFGDRMSEGVRISISKPKDPISAKVHIMGSRKQSSGTYRLRFFEDYPTESYGKDGHYYGKLPSLNFFRDAVSSKQSQSLSTIQSTLAQLIEKISQSRK